MLPHGWGVGHRRHHAYQVEWHHDDDLGVPPVWVAVGAYSMRTLPIVEVTWVDAASTHGWVELRTDQEKPTGLIVCQTVGYLTSKTRREIRVAQAMDELGKVAESWAIPRSNVRKIRVLR